VARRRDEGGAAVVEFLMISTLLILLLFCVLQLGVFFYARNIVSASAADAARFAASYGSSPSAGGARAEELIAEGLGGGDTAADIRCSSRAGVDTSSGLATVTVHCHGRVQALLAPIEVPLTIDFTASALQETRP
jgi:Flp pilus assembly protein TadG